MKHNEFMKNYIMPFLKKDDRPFNRQLYNNTKDMMHKDGSDSF